MLVEVVEVVIIGSMINMKKLVNVKQDFGIMEQPNVSNVHIFVNNVVLLPNVLNATKIL